MLFCPKTGGGVNRNGEEADAKIVLLLGCELFGPWSEDDDDGGTS